ncbi:MAG: SOS response-associated peptidase [Pseudomonadota bacterium]|nr:SOS response-associated peptidase [Pseudomonadota bacterium]
MCGRYSLTTAPEALRQLFNFDNMPNLAPRYNIAPTQDVPVIRPAGRGGEDVNGRGLAMMRWGLVPSWSKEIGRSAPMINVRAETIAEKPSFRAAFQSRKCLVPADGFYEWRLENGKKQPFRIGMNGGAPFAFAGLWERWASPEGDEINSVAIVTTEANEKLRPIHARMPVILDPNDYDQWLGETTETTAQTLLRPYPPGDMAFYRVGLRVNSVRHDDIECISPLKLQK